MAINIKMNHISVVVKNLDEGIARYKALFGVEPERMIGLVPEEGVKVALFSVGGITMEIVQPVTEAAGGVAKYLAKHGEGVHHVSFTVDDIAGEIQELTDRGVEVLAAYKDPPVVEGAKITFVHPRSANGVLFEFNQTASQSS